MARKVRNWDNIINQLNTSKKGERRIKMGSAGSAQVTRCRLLPEWKNLEARTEGAVLILTIAA